MTKIIDSPSPSRKRNSKKASSCNDSVIVPTTTLALPKKMKAKKTIVSHKLLVSDSSSTASSTGFTRASTYTSAASAASATSLTQGYILNDFLRRGNKNLISVATATPTPTQTPIQANTTITDSNHYWYHPIDPKEELILNKIEIEIALLAEENVYCNRPDQSKINSIDWIFVYEYASPSLKTELLKYNNNSGNNSNNNNRSDNCHGQKKTVLLKDKDRDDTLVKLLQRNSNDGGGGNSGNSGNSGMSLAVKLLRFSTIRRDIRRKLLLKNNEIRPRMASIVAKRRKETHPLRLSLISKKKKR